MVLLASLRGLPFMGVFLSKHLLLDSSAARYNLFLYVLLIVCVTLSFIYTYRFGFLLLRRSGGLSLGVSSEFSSYCFISFLPGVVNLLGSFCLLDKGYSLCYYSVVYVFFWIHLFGVLLGLFMYFYMCCFYSRSV